jgi:hypothetical protein
MTASWTTEQLDRICRSAELHIASRRADGRLHTTVPIWVVCVDDAVYVRTWYRRTTGWFGHVIDRPRARIRVPGVDSNVIVTDAGLGASQLRVSVDAAYLTKYGYSGAISMVTEDEFALRDHW